MYWASFSWRDWIVFYKSSGVSGQRTFTSSKAFLIPMSWAKIVGFLTFPSFYCWTSTFLFFLFFLPPIYTSKSWVFLDWINVTPFSFFHWLSSDNLFWISSILSFYWACVFSFCSSSVGLIFLQYSIRVSQFFMWLVYFFGLTTGASFYLSWISFCLFSHSLCLM